MIPTAVIIVAGGSGVRMGAALPKQFLPLKGRPILMHTIERFAEALPGCRIILVLPRSRTAYWQTLCEDHGFSVQHLVCEGGETRFDSVHNGLKLVGDADLVAIHDGVRPLVSAGLIRRAVADAEEFGAVVPVVTPTDSLREVGREGSCIVDRSRYRIVQTPQVFDAGLLKAALQSALTEHAALTDDCSAVERLGKAVYLTDGDEENIKITTPLDLIVAETILRRREEREAEE